MDITYSTRKDLPADQLYTLFKALGWTNGQETQSMLEHFNAPFINSTVVVSAWSGDCLIGCVRVLSDKIVRSVINDLGVIPEFQNRGIGRELVRRCVEHFPDSEWLVGTSVETSCYYEKIGFKKVEGVFLRIPSKWF